MTVGPLEEIESVHWTIPTWRKLVRQSWRDLLDLLTGCTDWMPRLDAPTGWTYWMDLLDDQLGNQLDGRSGWSEWMVEVDGRRGWSK